MTTQSLTQTPIFDKGQLVGFDDPIRKQTRLATEFEKKIYKDPFSSFQEKISKIDSSKIDSPQIKDIKLPDKIQESYDPRLGMFVSTKPEDQFGTSIVTRQPTIDESQRIREADIRGGTSISEIREASKRDEKRLEKYEKLTKRFEDVGEKELETIEKLSDKIDEEGYFTGTEKELERYNKAVEDYEKNIEKAKGEIERTGAEVVVEGEQLFFNPPELEKITIGFGGGIFSREVEASRFDFERRPIASTFSLLGSTAGSLLGGVGEVVGKKEGYFTIPERETTIYEPQFGTIQTDPLTGKEITGYKDVTLPEVDIGTKKQLRKVGEITGEVGVGVGKYLTPAGAYILGAEAGELELDMFKTKQETGKFTKEQKIEAAILGGTLLGVGALRGARAYRQPVFLKSGDDILVSTRGQQFFGKKVRFDKKRVSLSKEVPYKLKIQRQPIDKGKLPESVKEVEPFVLSADDPRTVKLLEQYLTPIKDTRGFARTIEEGSKALVFKPTPTKLRIGLKEFKLIPKGEERIFSGLSPFTKAGKIERARTLKEFERLGIKDITKPLIALQYPKVVEAKSDITGLTIESEKGMKLILKADETITQPKYTFSDRFGSITSRGRQPIKKIKKAELEPAGISTKEGEPIFRGQLLEYTKSRPLGKQTETFDIFSGVKKVGEKELQVLPTQVGDLTISRPIMFEFYKQADVSRKVIPTTRKIETGTARVILRKPSDKEIIDLDELYGLGKTKYGIKTKGKKSSQDYLQQLYKQDLLATGLTKVSPKIPKPKTPKTTDQLIKESQEKITTPSIWEGTGMYERTTGGALEFGRQDQVTTPTILTGITQLSLVDTRIDTRITPISFQPTKTKIETRLDTKPSLKLFEEVKPVQREETKLKERQREETKLKERQREETKLKERLATRQVAKQILRTPLKTKTPKPKIPKPKTPRIKIKLPFTSPKKVSIKETKFDEDDFKVFVKKMGEDIKLGEFKTLPKAREALKSELTETLRASGFIKKGKEKLGFEDVGLKDTGFRVSKVEPFRVVQRKTKRIKTGGEIGEILKVRKGGFFK